jgi:hypothetical protein
MGDSPRKSSHEYLAQFDEEILVLGHDEEFDDALVGVVTRFGMGPVALYDKVKVLEILERGMEDDDDPELTAIEWFEYNVIGAWVGEFTPAFVEFRPGTVIVEGGELRCKLPDDT